VVGTIHVVWAAAGAVDGVGIVGGVAGGVGVGAGAQPWTASCSVGSGAIKEANVGSP